MKVNADNVVIFQEIEHTRLAPATRIHNQLLIDFLPSQRITGAIDFNNRTGFINEPRQFGVQFKGNF